MGKHKVKRTQQHIDNWRKSHPGTNSLKGRTYEDIYGVEKARELKELRKKKRCDALHFRLRNLWFGMLNRCRDKEDKNYGGRGISVEWKDFKEFKKDMIESYKEGLTIDRVNTNGNYSKENCRWATRKEQANNRRNSKSIIYNGKRITVTELARKFGIKRTTLYMRLFSYGYSIEKALEV